jgi:glucose-1-phosphate thymidylyltransferase
MGERYISFNKNGYLLGFPYFRPPEFVCTYTQIRGYFPLYVNERSDMKAIIPVAGAGTKLRPHTYTQPKALIPIAGKTILSFIVDQLQEAGITEFIFIVGYLGDKIKDYVAQTYPDLTAHFVYQNERQGTGHAIELTRNIVAGDEVFVVLGDTICEYDIQEVIKSPHSMLGIKKVDDPRNFGVATINEAGFVEQVIEKPSIPKSNIALVGLYKIKETDILFECLQHLFINNTAEAGVYHLTDAIDCMIQRGAKFQAFKVKNWFDCGKKETLLESNATLLKKFGGNTSAVHNYPHTIIIPPVSIAPGCEISHCIIGPHVAIGTNTQMQHSIVRDSIIGSYTHLFEVVLDNSLIGSDASVKGLSRSLNIGDNTEIDFG